MVSMLDPTAERDRHHDTMRATITRVIGGGPNVYENAVEEAVARGSKLNSISDGGRSCVIRSVGDVSRTVGEVGVHVAVFSALALLEHDLSKSGRTWHVAGTSGRPTWSRVEGGLPIEVS